MKFCRYICKLAPAKRTRTLIAGVLKRLYVYCLPFLLSLFSIINGIYSLKQYYSAFPYICTSSTGNSIAVIVALLILTPSMCKWYKTSCYILIANRCFEILYYWLYFNTDINVFDELSIPYAMIIFGTASFIVWFFSTSFKKTCKLIHQSYRHGRR